MGPGQEAQRQRGREKGTEQEAQRHRGGMGEDGVGGGPGCGGRDAPKPGLGVVSQAGSGGGIPSRVWGWYPKPGGGGIPSLGVVSQAGSWGCVAGGRPAGTSAHRRYRRAGRPPALLLPLVVGYRGVEIPMKGTLPFTGIAPRNAAIASEGHAPVRAAGRARPAPALGLTAIAARRAGPGADPNRGSRPRPCGR